jgi:hypothetical protein
MQRFTIVTVITLLASVALGAPATVPGENELWELSRDDSAVRWLVIHNLAEGKKSGVFHVEVLERKLEDPAWRFTRLVAHMAVTQQALRASVSKPLRSGHVYPEHFHHAFAEWQKEEAAGTATICETAVQDCLEPR